MIVEVQRPQLSERHREINFVRRIEARENGMGGFDQATDAFGRTRKLCDGQRVTDGRHVGVVHRFVGFWLNGETHLPVVGQHLVERFDEIIHAAPGIFRLADVAAFAGEPKHDQVRAEIIRHVNAAQRALDGVLPAFRIVARIAPVNRAPVEPQARRDHFGGDARVREFLGQLLRFFPHLRVGLAVNVRHGVVVVEHHRVEAEPFELLEFPVERLGRTRRWTIRVSALADVPGAEAEFV